MSVMMIVDCLWKGGRCQMTDSERKEYDHWCDKVHIPDLLKGTGMTRVTRYAATDGSGVFYTQEFESEEAFEAYLTSDRRKELIAETNSHYPSGDGPENFFVQRAVRCFKSIYSEERKTST